MIYIDNAATRLGNFGSPNINSPYAEEEKRRFEESRKLIARCLGVKSDDIYFTSGGCEANSWVLQRSGCKNIITTKIEHSSILNCCKWLSENGYNVTYLDVDEHGYIDLFDLDEALARQTLAPTLVSIMYVNNEIGTCQYLEGIRNVVDYHNKLREKASTETLMDFAEPIYFHSDCVQAVGNVNIPVKCLDMMSASGHKFGAPYGVGFLYSKVPLQPLIFGGSQEKGLRGGTSNYEGVLDMATKLYFKVNSHADIKERVRVLREGLKDFDCIINTPEESESNIVSVSFKGVDAEKLMVFLSGFEIYVSSGSACAVDHKEHSHVLKAIKVPDEYINGTIRFSLSEFNTAKDIEKTLNYIKQYINLGGLDG